MPCRWIGWAGVCLVGVRELESRIPVAPMPVHVDVPEIQVMARPGHKPGWPDPESPAIKPSLGTDSPTRPPYALAPFTSLIESVKLLRLE